MHTFTAILSFLAIGYGLGCLVMLPAGPGVLTERRTLAWWMMPISTGLGLWLVVQFTAFHWLGLKVSPWLPMGLACLGWGRLAWYYRSAKGYVLEQAESSPETSVENLAEPESERLRNGVLVGILLLHLILLLYGSLNRPLPGTDPWGHCTAALYIRETGSLNEPFNDLQVIHYTDAYPAGLPVLVANSATQGTSLPDLLLWINALTATLALAWFHVLVRGIFRHGGYALAATALLAGMPGFLSRHPWGHTQAIAFSVAAFAFLVRLLEDDGEKNGAGASASWKANAASAACCLAGSVLTAPSQGLKIGLLAVLFFLAAIIGRQRFRVLGRVAAVGVGAGVLVLAAWLAPMYSQYGSFEAIRLACEPPESQRDKATFDLASHVPDLETQKTLAKRPIFALAGSGDRVYGWYDFFGFGFREEKPEAFAPVGCGGVGFGLAGLGIIFFLISGWRKIFEGNAKCPRAVGWWLVFGFIFCILGLQGDRLGVKLFPWRFWFLLSIFVSILAISGWLGLKRGLENIFSNSNPNVARKTVSRVMVGMLLIGVCVSLAWKVHLNIKDIRPKRFFHALETKGYAVVAEQLGASTWVYPLAGEARFEQVVGSGLKVGFWRREDYSFAQAVEIRSGAEVANWLQAQRYTHLLLDSAYGFIALRKALKNQTFSVSRQEFQAIRARIGSSFSLPRSLSGMLKEPRTLALFSEMMVAREVKRLLRSGRFEVYFNNSVVVCLKLKVESGASGRKGLL